VLNKISCSFRNAGFTIASIAAVATPLVALILAGLIFSSPCAAQQLANDSLSVSVHAESGSYSLSLPDGRPIFTSRVAAEVDHHWVRSTDYPHQEASESPFKDALGSGRAVTVTCSGLAGRPDLVYVVQLYDQHSYAAVQVTIRNAAARPVTVQSIRAVEATDQPILDLRGAASADRVLSDSFSEDWPALQLYDLGKAPNGMHRAVGSLLVYNRESRQSFFVGALTSDKFLTILHLEAAPAAGAGLPSKISSFTADSTGTTEIQKDFDLRNDPPTDWVELSLSVKPGASLSSERLMLSAGPDYRAQLLSYGDAIRILHHARVSAPTPIGWWSWTAFYADINEGETLSNADWLSQHLLSLGYKFFQIDEGYQYARGEYSTGNATQFPDGLRAVGYHLTHDGLVFGIWTGAFEVTARAWVYQHHKDWLVRNAKGEPIPSNAVFDQKFDVIYTLDTTNPGAQQYLRDTYRTLVREWGVRFIKLDFMDTDAIEGVRYRPNTTALEAQRIGLQIIRDTVGDGVILDKDGSPMLNAVGLVDTGRISQDTAHSFEATREAAPGIAARFYMNRNFFISDPDAFNTTSQSFADVHEQPATLSLAAAGASIALSSVSGGMHEIGDDLLTLGSQSDRLALVENADLLAMAKIGRASTPLDLMSYDPADEQPSIFFLRESPRQSILTVFNWTKSPRSHTLKLSGLGLDPARSYFVTDVLNPNASVSLADGAVQIEDQPAESVRVIKLVDSAVPPAAPSVQAQVPSAAQAGQTNQFSAEADPAGVPALDYHWDFGDGVTASGPHVSHAYTQAADFTVRLTVDGLDGIPTVQNFSVKVSGTLKAFPNLLDNRRFHDPADH
jgi:alpha-galactosidase